MGHGLYMAVQAGYPFENAETVADLTELQLLFLHRADMERQRRFLEAIADMFSE